jgi:hypothetical protein
VLSLRWVTVAEALAFDGATLDDVAAAAGLEMVAGMRRLAAPVLTECVVAVTGVAG